MSVNLVNTMLLVLPKRMEPFYLVIKHEALHWNLSVLCQLSLTLRGHNIGWVDWDQNKFTQRLRGYRIEFILMQVMFKLEAAFCKSNEYDITNSVHGVSSDVFKLLAWDEA